MTRANNDFVIYSYSYTQYLYHPSTIVEKKKNRLFFSAKSYSFIFSVRISNDHLTTRVACVTGVRKLCPVS